MIASIWKKKKILRIIWIFISTIMKKFTEDDVWVILSIFGFFIGRHILCGPTFVGQIINFFIIFEQALKFTVFLKIISFIKVIINSFVHHFEKTPDASHTNRKNFFISDELGSTQLGSLVSELQLWNVYQTVCRVCRHKTFRTKVLIQRKLGLNQVPSRQCRHCRASLIWSQLGTILLMPDQGKIWYTVWAPNIKTRKKARIFSDRGGPPC